MCVVVKFIVYSFAPTIYKYATANKFLAANIQFQSWLAREEKIDGEYWALHNLIE